MCGIAGLFGVPGTTHDLERLERMKAAIVHRGPDGEGVFVRGSAALGHRRLAIMDPEGGQQPIVKGFAALVANGEIYNDPEIRASYPPNQFRTQSDCEPPLTLWQRDGAGFTRELRGMYAIAALREGQAQQDMVLARDPFGIKPLYFAEYDGGIAFASEAQALRAAGFGHGGVRTIARDELLQLQFTTGRHTIFPGIQRVLPGETLRIANGRITGSTWRNVLEEARDSAAAFETMSDGDALKRLDDAMMDSVKAHLRSDVPLGLFLSGGIDSSAILAAVHRLGLPRPKAWTARFDQGAADESAQAAAVAEAVGAEHHVFTVTEDMVWRHLPEIVACMDDPVADYAIIPTWMLARQAAQDVKVVLCGEGGDELFAGYGRYRRAVRPWWRGGRAPYRAGTFGRELPGGRGRAWRDGIASAERAPGLTRLQQAQALDLAEWLPNDLLIKLDRCLMAHSVEGRTPFLDPVVAKAVWPMPERFKIRDGYGKWILRKWLQQTLPQAAPFAPKQGFTVPVGAWIAGHGKVLGQLVSRQPCIREVLPPARVHEIFGNAARREHARQAWTLLFYALWHRHHIAGQRAGGDVFSVLSCAP